MKVNETTETCNKYNAANEAAITAGLMDSWSPSDRILEQEAALVKSQQEAAALAAMKLGLLKQLDSQTDGKTCKGVGVRIESVGRFYNMSWRMYFGESYLTKKWIQVSPTRALPTRLSAKQIEKAELHIANIRSQMQSREQVRELQKQRQDRYAAFIKTQFGKDAVSAITGSYYIAEYCPTGFTVNENGTITNNGETFTLDQWRQLIILRKQHAAAIKEMKQSFNDANKSL